jgi:hypothetical protein
MAKITFRGWEDDDPESEGRSKIIFGHGSARAWKPAHGHYHVHVISEPRPFPISYLQSNSLEPVLISGLVNPYGPTLTVVTIVRDKTTAPPALAYGYLNPFKSELFVLGYLREGKLSTSMSDQILAAIAPFQVFERGATSVCMSGEYLEPAEVRYLYGHLFRNYPWLRSHMEKIKRFPMNPWDRVTEDLNESFEAMSQDQNDAEAIPDEPISDADMNELLDIVLDPEHNASELKAFLYAWKGSIDQQREFNNHEIADNAFQYEEFSPLLGHILESSGYEAEQQ